MGAEEGSRQGRARPQGPQDCILPLTAVFLQTPPFVVCVISAQLTGHVAVAGSSSTLLGYGFGAAAGWFLENSFPCVSCHGPLSMRLVRVCLSVPCSNISHEKGRRVHFLALQLLHPGGPSRFCDTAGEAIRAAGKGACKGNRLLRNTH